MGLLDYFRASRKKGSAAVARERLQILVAHDRAERHQPSYLPKLQEELIAVISDRVVGPRRATWSPGSIPRACRWAAAARLSMCRSAQEAVWWSSPLMNVIVRPEYSATCSIRSMSDSTWL